MPKKKKTRELKHTTNPFGNNMKQITYFMLLIKILCADDILKKNLYLAKNITASSGPNLGKYTCT